jgi:hypothetical protein
VDILRLKTRCRIGHGEIVVETIAVQRARADIGVGFEPAVACALHLDTFGHVAVLALNLQLQRIARGCPEAEARARTGARRSRDMRAKGQAVRMVMLVRIDRTF